MKTKTTCFPQVFMIILLAFQIILEGRRHREALTVVVVVVVVVVRRPLGRGV